MIWCHRYFFELYPWSIALYLGWSLTDRLITRNYLLRRHMTSVDFDCAYLLDTYCYREIHREYRQVIDQETLLDRGPKAVSFTFVETFLPLNRPWDYFSSSWVFRLESTYLFGCWSIHSPELSLRYPDGCWKVVCVICLQLVTGTYSH